MSSDEKKDVIIIGGSYAGLAAALSLVRSLKQVTIIDEGKPCNNSVNKSHNLIAHDGQSPSSIREKAKKQLFAYPNIDYIQSKATQLIKEEDGRFTVKSENGSSITAKKVLLATGLYDVLPEIENIYACWGKSVFSCPYCDAYEIRNTHIGIIGNGNAAFEMASLIYNWSSNLTIFTNGKLSLTKKQLLILEKRKINIVEHVLIKVVHNKGKLDYLVDDQQHQYPIENVFIKPAVKQHTDIPVSAGCELIKGGLIKVNKFLQTTVPGIYAAGDNCTVYRAIAVAIATGTRAGSFINRKILAEELSTINN